MSKFHSTVSRRDFMKGLGLAGAGLGAASVVGPKFNDLEDMVVTSNSGIGNPWWVKEREAYNPTNGVDWDFIKPFSPDFQGHRFGIKEGDPFPEIRSQWELAQLQANAPGMSLRDLALGEGWLFARRNSTANGLFQIDFTGEKVTTPEERGVPRYSASQEEASKVVRAALHNYGSPRVGFLEFNDRIKDLIVGAGNARIEDVDEAYMDGSVHVIPSKCKWLIVANVWQSIPHTKFGDHTQEPPADQVKLNIASTNGYSTATIITRRLQRFIKSLGYQALGGYGTGPVSYNVAAGIMAGLSELSRNTHQLTPDVGTIVRVAICTITDLPLEATKPIDAGMHKFCYTCKICGEVCPWDSINMDTDPSYDIPANNTWTRPGYSRWSMDFTKCHGCPHCDAACPFGTPGAASIHDFVRATVSTTSLFNGFFTNMDKIMGYGESQAYNEWWDRDLKTNNNDTILNATTVKA